MSKFLDYSPDQAYLLPPRVCDVLGPDHLCFFIRCVVAKLNLSIFRDEYGEEGGQAYAPEMLVSVWLYAYALAVTSSRRLEQRIREDLAFLVEVARKAKLGKLGHVAIDSTRIAANASRNRLDTEQALRDARARIRRGIRRWQKQCDAEDPNEGAGVEVDGAVRARLEQQLAEIPARLERLHKAGVKKLSRTDPDSRFLRERSGFTLGYTATLAVSEDHLILAQQVSTATNDTELLLPLVEAVRRQRRRKPKRVSADSGFFSIDNLQALEEKGVDAYVPDSNLARWLNRGGRLRQRATDPVHRRMRRKLRDPAGRRVYQRRKAIVEPVIGVLKEQRGMRRFARRGLAQVAVELALAATAYNLTRIWRAT